MPLRSEAAVTTATTALPTTANLRDSSERSHETPNPLLHTPRPKPYGEESTPMQEESVRKLDLLKFQNPLMKQATASHLIPSVTGNPTTASSTVTTNIPPARTCKRWGLPCPLQPYTLNQ